MSYNDLLNEEGIDSQYMAIIRPKIKVYSWVLNSGSVYKSDFDYGIITSVYIDGSALNEGSSPSLAASEFYYDFDAKVLYVRTSGGGDPSSDFVVAHFEIYVATFDKHWYRDPLDDTSVTVYWEPIIARSPSLKTTMSELLNGYMPIQTSSIILNNFEHTYEEILYESSFNKASIKIYHLLDELDDNNIKLVYDGLMGDVDYDQETIQIKCYDSRDILNSEYRNPGTDESFYDTSLFADLDPLLKGFPIRKIYGLVNGFQPANIDLKENDFTNNDNRAWAIGSGQNDIGDLSRTVGGGSHTTTRTYVDDATGFTIGDSVFFDRVSGTDEYHIIDNVDYGSNFIEHPALATAMTDGDTCKRSFVGNITIIQNDVKYVPLFGRDYTSNYSLSGGVIGFDFSTSMEANLSMPDPLSPFSTIFCRVYGQTNSVTLGGPAFGSNDDETGNLTNPVVILIKLMKELGISESQINQASFNALVSSANSPVGFSIPNIESSKFPTYKELILSILETILGRLYIDNDNKWKLDVIERIVGAEDKEIFDDEIIRGSFLYGFNYIDMLSDIIVRYGFKEVSENINELESWSKVTSVSDNAKYLHDVKKQKSFDSLLIKEADAQILADKLSDIYGERRGELEIRSKNRFFDTLLNDVIQVSRTKLPGFDYDGESVYSRKFSTISTEKSLKSVKIVLDDQKGIQDNNSGQW